MSADLRAPGGLRGPDGPGGRSPRPAGPGAAGGSRRARSRASCTYVFGVLALASLLVVVGTGVPLAMGGVAWWHTSSLGHFVNSMHLWSVEFFAVMVHPSGVPDGRVAGEPGPDLVHRRVCDLDRGRVHRLPLADELRRAVDRRGGQGRHQLDRDRRVLQRARPRPDDALARARLPLWSGSSSWPTWRARRHGVVPPLDAVGLAQQPAAPAPCREW